jgi:hypothetical protein
MLSMLRVRPMNILDESPGCRRANRRVGRVDRCGVANVVRQASHGTLPALGTAWRATGVQSIASEPPSAGGT